MVNINEENSKAFKKLVKKMFSTSLKYVKLNPKKFYCDINFASKDEIREINGKFRNKDKATDVLSFPMLNIKPFEKIEKSQIKLIADPVSHKVMLGDIVICKDVARENAEKYGHSEHREICYLIVHGYFHLLGFDHMNEDDKRLMRAAEDAVLKRYRISRDV